MHERVHGHGYETRKGVRTEFSVNLRSFRLGLVGQADVVQFHQDLVFPVEYKRGRAKKNNCDRVQLCAQAMCLEEMLHTSIPGGALFYGKTRRRQDVRFEDELRRETVAAANRLHEMIRAGKTPPPVYSSRCKRCSFLEICKPETFGKSGSVKRYIYGILKS